MNQILSVENKVKKNKQKNKTRRTSSADIRSIMKIFAIVIIIFGICCAVIAGYGFLKNNSNNKTTSNTKPTINVENVDDTHILISASHDKEISNITYYWNDEDENVIEGNGTNYLEEEIKLPTGTNMLSIIATDINGQSISYEKQYIAGSQPEITLTVEGTTIKAVITSEEGLSYVTYRWDDEDETKAESDSELEMDISIDIPQGLHTLTIIAVDINNNTATKSQDVNGVTKPTLDITTDGDNYIIKATDQEELKKLEYTLNDQPYSLDISGTEFEYTIPLQSGDNKLVITVYNSNNASIERKIKFPK